MDALGRVYDPAFYADQRAVAYRSAVAVMEVLGRTLTPASVVDVGCGVGEWLRALAEAGVRDYVGVDGDHVDRASLAIPEARFVARDLTAPLDLGRRFDLAVCVEVAEHLPESAADAFVGELTALAGVVLFSAAIPHQGGTGHVNEQWPGWWAARFASHGFEAYDCLRAVLWRDERVAWWYRQNLVLYADDATRLRHPGAPAEPLALVHPDAFAALVARQRSPEAAAARSRGGIRDRLRRPRKGRGGATAAPPAPPPRWERGTT